MQHTITAVFDTARHAQIAVDDLLVCDIPSETIHQYCLNPGDKRDSAMRPENEFHRPSGVWTWLINDHAPPPQERARQAALYRESRARDAPVLVAVEFSVLNERKIRKILNDHAPVDLRGEEGGYSHADTSFTQKTALDPSQFQPALPVEMTEYH